MCSPGRWGCVLARRPFEEQGFQVIERLLTHLLGTPSPPPMAPQLSHQESSELKPIIVQQIKRDRSDVRCMSNHEMLDPLGVT